MALNKRTYIANTTKITAANLNEIQDAVIGLENKKEFKQEIIIGPSSSSEEGSYYTRINSNPTSGIEFFTKGTGDDGITMRVIPDGQTSVLNLESMNQNSVRITGLDTPVSNYDAASKAYVDDAIPFIVEGTLTSKTDNSGGYDVNVTTPIKDIQTALSAGKFIVGYFIKNLGEKRFYNFSNTSGSYYFYTIESEIVGQRICQIHYSAMSASWSVTYKTYLPTSTTSDNGKFLQVVNGSPAWVALTNVAEEGA